MLGCLPDKLAHDYVNANATLASLLSSTQTLRLAGGPVLGGAFAPLGLTNVAGPDMLAQEVNPASDRSVSTAYKPYYRASERQLQATLQHDFGPVRLQLQGINDKSKVDERTGQFGVLDRTVFGPSATLAFSLQWNFGHPWVGGLLRAGRGGTDAQRSFRSCTSVPDQSNTGVFGGHRICAQDPSATTDPRAIRARSPARPC